MCVHRMCVPAKCAQAFVCTSLTIVAQKSCMAHSRLFGASSACIISERQLCYCVVCKRSLLQCILQQGSHGSFPIIGLCIALGGVTVVIL